MNDEAFTLTNGVFIYCVVMVISGSIANLAIEIQKSYHFQHSMWICQQMFIGETLALFVLILPLLANNIKRFAYFVDFRNELSLAKFSKRIGFLRAGFGGALDVFASCLELISILLIPYNYYALMKNGSIIFTAIFTVVLLKKPLFRHHWLGVSFIVIGFMTIAASSILKQEVPSERVNTNNASLYLGIFLMTFSRIFSSLRLVYQEHLFHAYAIDPKRIVGTEGVVGIITMTLVLIITTLIPCTDPTMCEQGFSFDSPSRALSQMYTNPRILIAGLVGILSILVFNISGVTLTKMVSAVFRVMVDSLRTVLLWLMAWLIGLYEINTWGFVAEFIGLIFLLAGNLIFTGYIEIGFLGFNKYVTNRRTHLANLPLSH